MKVYLVFKCPADCDSDTEVVGVFSSELRADFFIEDNPVNTDDYKYFIEERIVE